MYSRESVAALITTATITRRRTRVAIPAMIREERTGLYIRFFASGPERPVFAASAVLILAEAYQRAFLMSLTAPEKVKPREEECLPADGLLPVLFPLFCFCAEGAAGSVTDELLITTVLPSEMISRYCSSLIRSSLPFIFCRII